METNETLINEAKKLYNVTELTTFSNEGLNGITYDYGGDKLIKITGWYEAAFGPCDRITMEQKLRHVNNLKKKNILVPEILTNKNGNLCEVFELNNAKYIIYAMEKIIKIDNNNDFNFNWGLSLNKIHNNSIQNDTFNDYEYDWNRINNMCTDTDIKKVWQDLLKEVKSFKKTEDNYDLLHGDPQPNNFINSKNGLYTIDFDMMFNGFYAHDIAIGLQFKYANIKNYKETELPIEERTKIYNEFMDGYSMKNNNDIDSQIDTFLRYRRAMRFIGLYRPLQRNEDNFSYARKKVLTNEKIL